MAKKKTKMPPEVLEWFRQHQKNIAPLGGKARMTKMTPEQRSAVARLGGLAGGRGRPKRKAA